MMKRWQVGVLTILLAIQVQALHFPESVISTTSRDINATQVSGALITGSNGTVYACYVDTALSTVLAWLPLGETTWRKTLVGFDSEDDAHNLCSIGQDAQGYLWVAWDTHNAALKVKRSSVPHDPSVLVPATIQGTPASQISYPIFQRSGPNLYLLFRQGTAGVGDTWVMVMRGSDPWQAIAAPLVSGSGAEPDSQYFGALAGDMWGNLWLVWTARVGWYNVGVFYARYDAGFNVWRRSDGNAYALPITRFTAENILNDSLTDLTISNSGLAVSALPDGPHVVHAQYSGGHREAFHSRRIGSAWVTTQVSHAMALASPASRICEPPDPLPPSPCDLEFQGPQILTHGGSMAVLWGVSVLGRPPDRTSAWARLPAHTYASLSSDYGATWRTHKINRDVSSLGGEMARDASGAARVLFQELGAQVGRLITLDLSSLVNLPGPRLSFAGTLSLGNEIELTDSPAWTNSGSFSVAAWIRPDSPHPMAILAKEQIGGREVRLLWGASGHLVSGQLVYDPAYVQVAIGAASGLYGLVWYPKVDTALGRIAHLVLTFDGASAKVYLDGSLAASESYAGLPPDGLARPLVGAIKGYPAYSFEGWLALSYYGQALTADQVAILFEGGQPAP